MRKLTLLAASSALAACGFAEVADRPSGIKIGQRLTLRPYVSMSVSYDSNVNGRGTSGGDNDDVMWTINPGFSLNYAAENWSLLLNGYYNYHAYTKSENVNRYNQHSYGESLRWNWANAGSDERGWSLMLSETFQQVTMTDDISLGDGSGYSADRSQFAINGVVQRRFNEHWHGDVNASYYYLNYDNDTSSPYRSALYGWQRWIVGAEAGFAPSKWTDIIGAVNYQGYLQDNVEGSVLDRESQGYTAQIGLGSFATERISYRALVGWSRFDYSNGESSDDGFVYSISGNWKIDDTLQTMLLATSYYQPSEREHSARTRVDSVSWGIGKSLIRKKLRATFDLTYRHETHDCLGAGTLDYALDITTGRLGLDYTLNRFLAVYIYGEYQRSINNESDRKNLYCDYDRWRVTTGLRLTY